MSHWFRTKGADEEIPTLAEVMAEDPDAAKHYLRYVIGSLELWLDADDPSTIDQSTASPDVDSWLDKSGNGNDVSQATEANKPHTGTTITLGDGRTRNAIRFDDGASQYLSGVAVVTAAPFTIIYVSRTDLISQTQTPVAIGDSSTTTDQGWWGSQFNGGGYHSLFAGEGGGYGTAATKADRVADRLHVLTAVEEASDSRSAYLDGGFVGSSVVNKAPATADVTEIGRHGGTAPAQYLSGDICEVLIFSKALSETQRSLVESYLAEKWGVTLAGTPAQVPDLEGWFDPSDESTLSTSGSSVTAWANKVTNPDSGVTSLSGSAQGGGAAPQTGQDTINDLNALTINLSLIRSNNPIVTTTVCTIFAVYKVTSQDSLLGSDIANQDNDWFLYDYQGAVYWYDGANTAQSGAGALNTVQLATAREVGASERYAYLNGTKVGSDATAGGISGANSFNLFAEQSSGPANNFVGLAGEVLIYTRDLTAAERKKIESYLKTKWGIS